MKTIKSIIEVFKKTTTSKKLTAIIVAFWIIAIIADIVIFLMTGKTINDVVDYVNTSFLVVIGAYFTKSGVENAVAIKNTTNNTTTTSNDNTNQGGEA